MEYIADNFVGIVAIICIFGLPIIAVVMAFWSSMHKKSKDKEIRQLIIENHTDPETAKLLIDEPKKQPRKMGPFNLDTLRAACVLRLAGGHSNHEYLFLAHHRLRYRYRSPLFLPRRDAPLQEIRQQGK